MSKSLNQYSIEELAPLLKRKEISPVEVTSSVLKQIKRLDSKVNSYILVTEESALEAAKKAEEEIVCGNYLGPLHGIPMALKDNIYIKGEKTTIGSKIHRNFIPEYDATVVSKLREKGVIFTGKLNVHEYTWGATNDNPHFGACRNPWDLERIPGASSGGSGAAIAAHMTIASLGSDTGGSIRTPASFCGIVGLKPTYGRVSKYGAFPLAWSLDHIGPMGKTVMDCALLLEATAGFDEQDPTTADFPVKAYSEQITGDVKGLRIGVNEDYFFKNIDKNVEDTVRKGLLDLEKEGAILVEVEIPSISHAEYALMTTLMPEASAVHRQNLLTRQEDFGDDVRLSLKTGELVSAVDYVQAQQMRWQLNKEFQKIFQSVDVLITPTSPFSPPKVKQTIVNLNGKDVDYHDHVIRLISPFNLVGLPAISIPCGYVNGLPIGMQIVGPAFKEDVVLNTAFAYEQTHLSLRRNPSIVE